MFKFGFSWEHGGMFLNLYCYIDDSEAIELFTSHRLYLQPVAKINISAQLHKGSRPINFKLGNYGKIKENDKTTKSFL